MEEIKQILSRIKITNILSSLAIIIISFIIYKVIIYLLTRGGEKTQLNMFTSKKSKTYMKLLKSIIRYAFIIITALILLQVNGVNIPVLCRAGNTVYSSQLKKRVNYTIMYGSENAGYVNGQFVIQNSLCPKANQIPSTSL